MSKKVINHKGYSNRNKVVNEAAKGIHVMDMITNKDEAAGEQKSGNRLTITELAEKIGITAKTIIRWEKAGKIRRPKRDWKGWRFYEEEDIEIIKKIVSTVYEI